MLEITNGRVQVRCREDGSGVVLVDAARHRTWSLDERTRWCAVQGSDERVPLGPGRARRTDDGALRQEFAPAGQAVTLEWRLLGDGVEVTARFAGDGGRLRELSLPGSFLAEGDALTIALPMAQGLLFDGSGEAFEQRLLYGGHFSLSMAMLGYLTPSAGLLGTVEDWSDWDAVAGRHEAGPGYAYPVQRDSLGAMRYERRARLYCTDGDLTSLCRRYRSRVQERGRWKPWADKIAERPGVERLFGALMAFIGYNQDDLDYVAQCRRLRAMGFDRVFLYPVRFNHYSTDFLMGGDPPIELSDADLAQIRALGYDVSPWTWVFEGLDDGSGELARGFTRGPDGLPVPHWRIDDFQWYQCCTPLQEEFVRRQYQGAMAAMTWSHYDVTATVGPRECYATDHPWHPGTPLDRRGDEAFVRRLLSPEANGDRVVSSEGFRDCLADVYDIGSTKMLPSWGAGPFRTVPMALLVYHDVVVQDWWEVHNYNLAGGNFGRPTRWGLMAEGQPRAKAVMDALYGCPPNVFPFGRQYYWVDYESRRTAHYSVRLDDAAVQEALAAALPVTRLHRRLGRQDLRSHAFLSDDGAVQVTEFGDGTRVFANFAAEERQAGDAGALPGLGWRVL